MAHVEILFDNYLWNIRLKKNKLLYLKNAVLNSVQSQLNTNWIKLAV